MKVKEESEKAGWKLNIQKTKIVACGPITSWQIDGETMETEILYFGAPKSLQMVIAAMKLKDACSLQVKAVTNLDSLLKSRDGRSQDGGGIGRGDHFLSYKFIKRIIERRANFTKQLLITSWGHQVPRKATLCLQKEVGQNIKDNKRDKRARDGDPSQEESLNRGSFQSPGNPLTGGSGGSFQILEGNLTGRENK